MCSTRAGGRFGDVSPLIAAAVALATAAQERQVGGTAAIEIF